VREAPGVTTYKARKRTDGDYGNSPQAAALRLQLAGLAKLEESEVYQEMMAAANARRLAGGDYAHGWGEFSANGDPRKRRKVAV
jgi:hypothetical protein